ncbi:ubiquitin carboxyl-terminal hydrolase 36-like [Condylostylus longicornis]|uniref:ubiquitin carboxyl-terminal hydrolase 36-like n=1 Tax=Condylostylus longicornis TaxID=2530218 RepID=UPI00244D9F56|nr:ubiquitin carboxyl-terminal hydrolase 36-like [Condylostylus longicornis]
MASSCAVHPAQPGIDQFFISLAETTIVNKTVKFRLKTAVEESVTSLLSTNEEKKTDTGNVSSPILDVLETNRPPDLPQHWFYPPGHLGSFQWGKKWRYMGRGLLNYANTCFLNATIQALAYCPPFAQDCLAAKHSNRCLRKKRNQVCGFCQFEILVRNLFSKTEEGKPRIASFPPLFIKLLRKEIKMNQGISFGGNDWFGVQNCAHEWLIQFIDLLSKYDLPPELQQDFENGRVRGADSATCYLQQMFSSCFQESKICQVCHKSTSNYELNTCIRVSITDGSLESGLQHAFKPELLSGSNQPMAEFRAETKKTPKWKDRYGMFDSKVKKNCTQMRIPLKLKLEDFMTPECQKLFCSTSTTGEGTVYEFSASVNHAGSAGFGHYWSTVVGPDGLYYKLDDELITQIPPSLLLQQLGSSYLLFYTRRTPVNSAAPIIKAGESITLYRSKYDEGVEVADTIQEAEEEPWKVQISLGLNVPNMASQSVPNMASQSVPNMASQSVPNMVSQSVPNMASQSVSTKISSEMDNLQQPSDESGRIDEIESETDTSEIDDEMDRALEIDSQSSQSSEDSFFNEEAVNGNELEIRRRLLTEMMEDGSDDNESGNEEFMKLLTRYRERRFLSSRLRRSVFYSRAAKWRHLRQGFFETSQTSEPAWSEPGSPKRRKCDTEDIADKSGLVKQVSTNNPEEDHRTIDESSSSSDDDGIPHYQPNSTEGKKVFYERFNPEVPT